MNKRDDWHLWKHIFQLMPVEKKTLIQSKSESIPVSDT